MHQYLHITVDTHKAQIRYFGTSSGYGILSILDFIVTRFHLVYHSVTTVCTVYSCIVTVLKLNKYNHLNSTQKDVLKDTNNINVTVTNPQVKCLRPDHRNLVTTEKLTHLPISCCLKKTNT